MAASAAAAAARAAGAGPAACRLDSSGQTRIGLTPPRLPAAGRGPALAPAPARLAALGPDQRGCALRRSVCARAASSDKGGAGREELVAVTAESGDETSAVGFGRLAASSALIGALAGVSVYIGLEQLYGKVAIPATGGSGPSFAASMVGAAPATAAAIPPGATAQAPILAAPPVAPGAAAAAAPPSALQQRLEDRIVALEKRILGLEQELDELERFGEDESEYYIILPTEPPRA